MTAVRFPIPGGDDGLWGNILNAFLAVEHNVDGTLKNAELTSRKGVASGYAGLNSDGIVPDGQLAVPLSKVGDYISVYMNTQTVAASGGGLSMGWDGMAASRGSSLSWSVSQPDSLVIQEAGVYAIHVQVDWQDAADTSGSSREIQIFCECGFLTFDKRPSIIDGNINVDGTIQILPFTVYLQPGDNISVSITQWSASVLSPVVTALVTRLS